ncbi:hypothetical protein [Kitasatospora aureofaciens]|uniref:hypothetical protein n=1 Tax=Kitasatospora aureofaciens TaxID=1894 RepID=UPI001C4948A9|nr:hypothetical protein [Kitasatospora aureofaciens]MBV6702705.1 hypothetical protein [Kitasatospora aureofaciens]
MTLPRVGQLIAFAQGLEPLLPGAGAGGEGGAELGMGVSLRYWSLAGASDDG